MGEPVSLKPKHWQLIVQTGLAPASPNLCERRPAQEAQGAGKSVLQGGGQRMRAEEEEAGFPDGLIGPQELAGGLLVQTGPGPGSP